MKLPVKILTFLVLIISIAHSTELAAQNSIVKISGKVDEAMWNEIQNLPVKTRQISIESTGGREDIGIKIGNYLNQHDIDVRVETFCLSSCAMYVLAGAPHVIVSEGALVGFHVPALVTYQILHRIDPKSKLSKKLEFTALEAVKLYNKTGKDYSILGSAFIASNIKCVAIEREHGEVARAATFPLVDVWIPSRSELVAKGWVIQGSWPTSQAEAEIIRRKYLKAEAVVRFGDVDFPKRMEMTLSESGCLKK